MTPRVYRLNRSAVVLAAVLALAGCGADAAEASEPDCGALCGYYVDLPDGRVVTCVTYTAYKVGGLDCDWANAALEGEAP